MGGGSCKRLFGLDEFRRKTPRKWKPMAPEMVEPPMQNIMPSRLCVSIFAQAVSGDAGSPSNAVATTLTHKLPPHQSPTAAPVYALTNRPSHFFIAIGSVAPYGCAMGGTSGRDSFSVGFAGLSLRNANKGTTKAPKRKPVKAPMKAASRA